MIALTSIQPSRLQVLVDPVPNGDCPHGSISKASGIGSEGTEEVSACHLPGRRSVLSEARRLSKEATLPILCDCQSERPWPLALDCFGPIGPQGQLEDSCCCAG